jgi:formyl-CoA transferase
VSGAGPQGDAVGDVAVPGIVPKLLATPGSSGTPTSHLSGDPDAVLRETGPADADFARLRAMGIVT